MPRIGRAISVRTLVRLRVELQKTAIRREQPLAVDRLRVDDGADAVATPCPFAPCVFAVQPDELDAVGSEYGDVRPFDPHALEPREVTVAAIFGHHDEIRRIAQIEDLEIAVAEYDDGSRSRDVDGDRRLRERSRRPRQHFGTPSSDRNEELAVGIGPVTRGRPGSEENRDIVAASRQRNAIFERVGPDRLRAVQRAPA